MFEKSSLLWNNEMALFHTQTFVLDVKVGIYGMDIRKNKMLDEKKSYQQMALYAGLSAGQYLLMSRILG